jgi:hypothetical protein
MIKKNAIVVLTIAVLSGAALLGVGCGGGGDDGPEHAVKWVIDRSGNRPTNAKQVRVLATLKSCGLEPPRLERPIIEYEDNRAYIELRQAPEDVEDQKGCLLSLYTGVKMVTLERNLYKLILFDASTDPPEQRWPRKRRPGE